MPPVSTPPLTLAATWPDGDRADVRLGPPFAEGGDAHIHPVTDHPALVAKVYHDPSSEPRRRAKLDAMLATPPEGALSAEGGEVALSWPVALLERGGAAEAPAGFLMPRVDLAHAADLELLLARRARRAAGLPESYRFRVSVAANLAALVAALHARGHHVVDLKPSNVHVYRASGRVAVLDCDGLSVAGRGGERFPAHQYTDGYIAPEALRAKARPEALGEAQDRFALAVLVFRLLCDGLHPFQGVPRPGADVPTTDGERVAAGLYPYGRGGADGLSPPPSSLYGAFDRRTRALFDLAFDGPPSERPSAAVWRDHLRGLLEGGLRSCKADADHARFGRGPCIVCPPKGTKGRGGNRERVTEADKRAQERAMNRVQQPAAPSAKTRSVPRAARRRAPSAQPTVAHVALATGTSRNVRGCALGLFGLALGLTLIVAVWIPAMSEWDPIRDAEPWLALYRSIEVHNASEAERAFRRGDGKIDLSFWATPPPSGDDVWRRPYVPLDDAVGYPLGEGSGCEDGPDRDPRYKSDILPYLHHAAHNRMPATVDLLLRNGAPADGYDYDGRTSLMVAAGNCGPRPALSEQAIRGIVRLGQRLAQASTRRGGGETGEGGGGSLEALVPLRPAAPDGPAEGVEAEALVQSVRERPWVRGLAAALVPLDPDSAWTYRTRPDSLTKTYWIAGAHREIADLVRNAAVIDRLLRVSSIEARDSWGRSALTYAAARGNVVAVRQLLAAGADPDAADDAGVTPLMAAADQAATVASDGVARTVALELLAWGALPDKRDRGGRTAADYVGDRPATRRIKLRDRYKSLGTVKDTVRFAESRTLALLQVAARAGGALQTPGARRRVIGRAAGEAVPLASASRADIGDGRTRVAGGEVDDWPDWVRPAPWLADTLLQVTCAGIPRGDLDVEVTLVRKGRRPIGEVWRTDVAGWRIDQTAVQRGRASQNPYSPIYDGGYPPSRRFREMDTRDRCLGQVREALYSDDGRILQYDLRDEVERWPSGTVTVEVLPAPDTAP